MWRVSQFTEGINLIKKNNNWKLRTDVRRLDNNNVSPSFHSSQEECCSEGLITRPEIPSEFNILRAIFWPTPDKLRGARNER